MVLMLMKDCQLRLDKILVNQRYRDSLVDTVKKVLGWLTEIAAKQDKDCAMETLDRGADFCLVKQLLKIE
jgi:hypothetical protein